MKRPVLILLALFVLFVGLGLVLPSRVRVERTRMLGATPERLFPLVADLQNGWPQWSDFGKAHDPKLVETFSGPPSGAGATDTWTGGSMPPGHMTLTEADPASGVRFVIEMANGAHIAGAISFSSQDSGTSVHWSDDIDLGRGILAGWGGLIIRPMLGRSMETSLARLDQLARK
jgi:hypothetical protein